MRFASALSIALMTFAFSSTITAQKRQDPTVISSIESPKPDGRWPIKKRRQLDPPTDDKLVPNPAQVPLTDDQIQVIRMINYNRYNYYLPPLVVEPTLSDVAEQIAEDMAEEGKLALNLRGSAPAQIVTDATTAYEAQEALATDHSALPLQINKTYKYIGVSDATTKVFTEDGKEKTLRFWSVQMSVHSGR